MKKIKTIYRELKNTFSNLNESQLFRGFLGAAIGLYSGLYFYDWFSNAICWNSFHWFPILIGILVPLCYGFFISITTFSWLVFLTIPIVALFCQFLWLILGGIVGLVLSLASDPFPAVVALFFLALISVPAIVIIFIGL